MNGPEPQQTQESGEEPELTPEQVQALQAAMALRQLMTTPVRLPTMHNVVPLQGESGEPAILIESVTPAGTQRLVLTRDEALAFASRIRKAAHTGPALPDEPEKKLYVPGGAGRLAVPGR